VADRAPLSRRQRLAIYRTAWWLRIFESLEEDYPALARCLGPRTFSELIRSYLETFPSQSYTLVHASDRLPEYVGSRWRHARKRPWMKDLARVERALYRVFHAQDPNPWDPAQLSTLDKTGIAKLQLKLEPSTALIRSLWDLKPVLDGTSRRCQRGTTHLLILREGAVPNWRVLSPQQHRLLQMTANGQATLGGWMKAAGRAPWIEWLGDWARVGALAPVGPKQRKKTVSGETT
jgi:hypothetical protein